MRMQFDKRHAAYSMYDNSFTRIDNMPLAQELRDRFIHRKWTRVLNHFAKLVNPHYSTFRSLGGYWWVVDQMEIATDILFRDTSRLKKIMPDLIEHSIREFSCTDVLHFLGRKPHGNLKGEVTIDLKKRPEGCRTK